MSDGHPRAQATRPDRRPRTRMTAVRALRAGAAVLLAATVVVLLPASAGATTVPGAAPALPAWTANDNLELSVNPSSRLSPNGAEITVRGSGYNRNGELWIAVCQDDGVAPEQFAHCLGGAIPNANASTAWAVVTPDGNPRYAGPVNAKFGGRGQFKVTMQIPVAAGQDADCIQGSCSVYTRSADPADRSQDAGAGIKFSTPRPSSETAPSTEVVGGTSTPIDPDSIAAPEISPGEQQTVVFSTFTPQEAVDVTLYSDPIALPTVTANGAGVVTVSFDVPADLPLGEHLIQAVGRTSGIVGVAAFSVVEPLVTTTDTATETTDATPTSTSADVTETSSEAPVAPDETGQSMTTLGEAEETPSSEEPPVTATDDIATTEPAAGAADTDGGNRLLWLWIMLAAIVVIGGAAAVVALTRRRRDLEGGGPGGYDGGPAGAAAEEPEPAPSWEDLRAQAPVPEPEWPLYGGDTLAAGAEPEGQMPGGLDQLFGAAAAAQQAGVAPTGVTTPQPGPAPAGLGQHPAPPVTAPPVTAPPTTQPIAAPPVTPAPAFAPDDGGPATEQFRPVFGDARDSIAHDDGGPATEQFRPLFLDDAARGDAGWDDGDVDADAADYLGDDPDSRRGRHHRSD